MEPIYIAAFISFVIGLFGYIVVRFWILPIDRYIRIKRRLVADLIVLLDMVQTEPSQKTEDSQIRDRKTSIRRLSSDLASVYGKDLPYWYRLYLESKKERPIEAAESSMRLSNTKNMEHFYRQADEIKSSLRLK